MKQQLELKDLNIGRIDAKYELISPTEKEVNRFIDAYLVPDNIIIEDYINGDLFYVTGLKGTGKTALLRYLAIKAQREKKADYVFFLFKSHLSEEEKINFGKNTQTLIVDKSSDNKPMQDYETVWKLFFHRFIADHLQSSKVAIFAKNDSLKKYVACAMAPKSGSKLSGIWKLFPKLKKGTIDLDLEYLKFGLEFDWADDKQRSVTLDSLVLQLDNLFLSLNPGDTLFYIFVDELEINLGNQELYTRDAILIRDLIITIEKFNILCKEKGFPLRILAGIRSEVLGAVAGFGKEINKPIGSFGNNITWHQSGGDISKHSLLKMIYKKLVASEEFCGILLDRDPITVWDRYFPPEIQRMAGNKFILHNTWYRPRDIVRMLTLIQKQYPNNLKFSHDAFDGTRKQYSTESWVELTEELSVRYSPAEINGIRRLLYGFRPFFSLPEIERHGEEIRRTYRDVSQLLDKFTIENVLVDLYKIGAIGNGEKNNIRFAFRGDDELLLEKRIMLHPALGPYFSVWFTTPS